MNIVEGLLSHPKEYKIGDKVIITEIIKDDKFYQDGYIGTELYVSSIDNKIGIDDCNDETKKYCDKVSKTQCIYLSDTKSPYDSRKTKGIWTCKCLIKKVIGEM